MLIASTKPRPRKRYLKNVFAQPEIQKAVDKGYYHRPGDSSRTLKIGGANVFLGLDKEGNDKPTEKSRTHPGFMYSPRFRVAGTQADFLNYATKLHNENPEAGLFAKFGGPAGLVNTIVSGENYTHNTVRKGGILRIAFETEIANTKRIEGKKEKKPKLDPATAASLFEELVAARRQGEQFKGYKFEYIKGAKPEGKKRTGGRKGRGKKAESKSTGPLPAGTGVASPTAMAAMPVAGGFPAAGMMATTVPPMGVGVGGFPAAGSVATGAGILPLSPS